MIDVPPSSPKPQPRVARPKSTRQAAAATAAPQQHSAGPAQPSARVSGGGGGGASGAARARAHGPATRTRRESIKNFGGGGGGGGLTADQLAGLRLQDEQQRMQELHEGQHHHHYNPPPQQRSRSTLTLPTSFSSPERSFSSPESSVPPAYDSGQRAATLQSKLALVRAEYNGGGGGEMPSSGSSPRAQRRNPARGGNETLEVLFDFEPTQADEIRLNVGELVQILEAPGDGWVKVRKEDRSVGFCPEDYIGKNRTAKSAQPSSIVLRMVSLSSASCSSRFPGVADDGRLVAS